MNKPLDANSTPRPLRVVYMGTPDFAAIILRHLLTDPIVEVVAVYCQPDKPVGRGRVMQSPPTKLLAAAQGIAVEQPASLRDDETVARLAAYAPDLILVAAYGLLLPQRVLDIPQYGAMNVHASLLPKYRGAAPIQRAIMEGESVTGVTIMQMEQGLDCGPILLQRAVGIDINETSADLHTQLALEGAVLLVEALYILRQGRLRPIVQDDTLATHAAKLCKADAVLDLRQSAAMLHAQIRGMFPWPGASLILHREGQEPLAVKVGPGRYPLPQEAHALATQAGTLAPGQIAGVWDDALLVACGDGYYAFSALQPAGKKAMGGTAFVNGYVHGEKTFFTVPG